MRTYILQIHTTLDQSEDMDNLFIFADFDNLCKEFENRVRYLERCCDEKVYCEYPSKTEDGVQGYFRVENKDGTVTVGNAYDYDILDDD